MLHNHKTPEDILLLETSIEYSGNGMYTCGKNICCRADMITEAYQDNDHNAKASIIKCPTALCMEQFHKFVKMSFLECKLCK